MWAIVPVKHFGLAKGRLARALSAAERAGLARAMLTDVLGALAQTGGVTHTLVVTADVAVADLARSSGARQIPDPGTGLNPAVHAGVRHAAAAGADQVMIVHGDLPLATAADFEALLRTHAGPEARRVTLAPDTQHDGTNCLAVSPPALMNFHFGEHSFSAHEAEARRHGARLRVVERRALGLDVDHPEDLARIADAAGTSATVAFLHGSGIASRIAAAALPAAAGPGTADREAPARDD